MKPHMIRDIENIETDMRQVVNLLDLLHDELGDNGVSAARRELVLSGLSIARDHLALLTDMQGEVVGHMRGEVQA